LDLGRLRVGDRADFILIDAPTADRFNILQTYIKGELVAENGRSLLVSQPVEILNNFGISAIHPEQLQTPATVSNSPFLKVISVRDGQLITDALTVPNQSQTALAEADILKMVVINRYKAAPIASAYIHNMGIKNGAIGSCVAHDSHNIIVVGSSDELISKAANLIIAQKGGISAVSETESQVIPLPIAGIMSDADVYEVAKAYTQIDAFAKALGSNLRSPFMSLSFMALLVIPKLKLSDLGLFDGEKFAFTPVGMDTNG
jgi:adenine deaminase